MAEDRNEAAPAEVNPESPYRVFAYVVAERSELYVDVVDTLVAAKDRFRLQLRPGDVVRELAASGRHREQDEILSALEALAEWGNVSRFYDSAAPETLTEFYGRRFLYQLTPEGVAAHDGVEAARRAGLDSGGRLSAVLLPGIVERLQAVRAEVEHPDPARLYALLIDLFSTFTELADNAGRYMSDLAVETTEVAADHDRFVAYKRAVFAYLNTFVARFTELMPAMVEMVAELVPVMARLLTLAAAADAAPSAAGDDQGPLDALDRRWRGVRAWFLSDGDQAPIAESLRMAMLDALNRILVAVTRLNERQLRRASREADFGALARWFAATDTDDDAHQLWDAAFGTYAARHFTDLAGDEDVERRRSFWDAAPATVAPRLRVAGVRASPGRPGPVADYSAAKEARIAAVRAARARAAAAAERLALRTPCRLSALGSVDAEEFDQLLAMLSASLASHAGPEGARRVRMPFGQVVLRPATEGGTATIRTPGGLFHAPDLLLDVRAAGGSARSADADEVAG